MTNGGNHRTLLVACGMYGYSESMPTGTHSEASAIQQDIFRRMKPEERLAMALEMSESLRRVAMEGLRSRRPELSEEELSCELLRLMYGFAARP